MMRQNSIPTIPNPFNKDKLNQYEVNNDDRVEVLCYPSSKGIFKIAPKKVAIPNPVHEKTIYR